MTSYTNSLREITNFLIFNLYLMYLPRTSPSKFLHGIRIWFKKLKLRGGEHEFDGSLSRVNIVRRYDGRMDIITDQHHHHHRRRRLHRRHHYTVRCLLQCLLYVVLV